MQRQSAPMRMTASWIHGRAESHARYIAAIRAFQNEDDPYPFVAFFCLNLTERLERVLGLLTGVNEPDEPWRVSGIGGFLDGDDDIPKYHPSGHADTLDDTLGSAILELLRESPSMTQGEIADRVGKSVPTVKRAMRRLVESGAIARTGGKRYGSWEVR